MATAENPTKSAVPESDFVQEILACASEEQRSQYLQSSGLLRPEVALRLCDESRTKLRIDGHQALVLAEAAVGITRELDDQSCTGQALRSKANALYVLGENSAALECHAQALALFQKSGNVEEEARTLNASIQPYLLIGDYDHALHAADRARQLFRELKDDRRLAHVEINVGNVFHRQDRFDEALDCYHRAYDVLLPLNDAEGLAVALYNISVSLISLNDFSRALSTYQNARETFVQRGMKLLVGQADYNIAYLYYLRGEYGRAIDMLRAAREKAAADGDAHIEALCYLDLSDIYLELNLSTEAGEEAHEGVARFRKLKMGYEEAKCLTNEAIASGQQHRALQAIDVFSSARAAFIREKNHVWPWLIDLYRAAVLFNAGRLFEARHACQAALEFFEKSSMSGKEITCRLLLGQIELQMDQPKAALRHFEDAIHLLDKFPKLTLHCRASLLAGKAHEAAGDASAAYAAYQEAQRAMETLGDSPRRDELKITSAGENSEVYERLTGLCLSGKLAGAGSRDAFQYVEMAKCRRLADLAFQHAHESSAAAAGGGNSDMVRKIRDLREELNWYYHRIEQAELRPEQGSEAKLEALQTKARTREQTLLQAARELPETDEDFSSPYRRRAIGLEQLQAVLDPETTVVEYFAIGEELCAAIVTQSNLEFVPLTLLPSVAQPMRQLHSQFARASHDGGYLARFEKQLLRTAQDHLREIYEEIFQPIESRLRGKHLVFVPHGILHSLPFHALFDGEAYVVDRFTVSYAPSSSLYALCQKLPPSPGHSALVIGVPDSRSAAAVDEAAAVAKILETKDVFVGESASEKILAEYGPKAAWIHLATRGHFHDENPVSSGIRLGQSYLSLFDLSRLKLSAEMIALSRCAGGPGAAPAEEELLGLIRALLATGAQSLLLALWNVDEADAGEFMKHLYAQIRLGEQKAYAVRYAMLAVRERWPHPYRWAPFFLVGKASRSAI